MTYAMTAEDLFQNLKQMPMTERQRFFGILSMNAFRDEDMSHEQLFGHLADDEFTLAAVHVHCPRLRPYGCRAGCP